MMTLDFDVAHPSDLTAADDVRGRGRACDVRWGATHAFSILVEGRPAYPSRRLCDDEGAVPASKSPAGGGDTP